MLKNLWILRLQTNIWLLQDQKHFRDFKESTRFLKYNKSFFSYSNQCIMKLLWIQITIFMVLQGDLRTILGICDTGLFFKKIPRFCSERPF